jgi:hypothetical protein
MDGRQRLTKGGRSLPTSARRGLRELSSLLLAAGRIRSIRGSGRHRRTGSQGPPAGRVSIEERVAHRRRRRRRAQTVADRPDRGWEPQRKKRGEGYSGGGQAGGRAKAGGVSARRVRAKSSGVGFERGDADDRRSIEGGEKASQRAVRRPTDDVAMCIPPLFGREGVDLERAQNDRGTREPLLPIGQS